MLLPHSGLNNPENHNFYLHCREDLKSYVVKVLLSSAYDIATTVPNNHQWLKAGYILKLLVFSTYLSFCV